MISKQILLIIPPPKAGAPFLHTVKRVQLFLPNRNNSIYY